MKKNPIGVVLIQIAQVKFSRILKLLTLILFAFTTHISAGLYSQEMKISINAENITVSEIFNEIQKQTGCTIFYFSKDVDVSRKISVKFNDEAIEVVLEEVLKGTAASFTISGKDIIIKAKSENTPKNNSKTENEDEKVTIIGIVSDAKNNVPIPGVAVLIKGASKGTITDFDGKYKISIEEEDAILQFSCIGYETVEMQVNGRIQIDIEMKETLTGLDEVVVVGYGIKKKENLTGAVATVSNEELTSRPITSISEALNGVVSNLQIISNSGGEPGADVTYQLRGAGSISGFASSEPLILVDGVEADPSLIHPNDVESISVLKDAAASSIYGSKAPYGVILIKTKQGRKGKPKIYFSSNTAWRSARKPYKKLGTIDHLDYWRHADLNDDGRITQFTDDWYEAAIEAAKDPNLPDVLVDENDSTQWGRGVATDMDNFHQIFKKYAITQDYNLSVSGGTDKTSYYFSGGLTDMDGQLRLGEDYYKRYSFLGKFNGKVTNWLEISYRIQYAREKYKNPPSEWVEFRPHKLNPLRPVYDPNGHVLDDDIQMVAEDAIATETENNNFNNTLSAILTPLKGLKIQTDFSYNLKLFDVMHYQNPVPRYTVQNELMGYYGVSQLEKIHNQNNYTNINFFSDYSKTIGNHNFYVLGGFQQEVMDFSQLKMRRNNRIENEIYSIRSAVGDAFDFSDYDSKWATQGYFGRLTYNFSNKYLLEFNARYDGSSRFPKENRWGFFPSASVGYAISKEPYFESLTKWVSFLKIRASYGRLGNTNLNENDIYYQASMSKETTEWLSLDGRSKYETISTPKLGNAHLTWEKPSTFDVGVDMNLFDNKVQIVFDWYNRITKDMVGPSPPVASIVGLARSERPLVNNTELQSRGWEAIIGYRNQFNKINYKVGFSISSHKETVTKYYNPEGKLPDIWNYNMGGDLMYYYEGMVLGEIWGYETVGFINDEETRDEINRKDEGTHDQSRIYGGTWNMGDIIYKDINGDGEVSPGKKTLTDHGDLKIIGNETPAFEFNISISANWKGFDFRSFWNGNGPGQWYPRRIDGQESWYNHWLRRQFFGTTQGSDYPSLEIYKGNYWTPENKDAYYPNGYLTAGDIRSTYRNTEPQTKYLQSTAYLRLKNLQIGYTIPAHIINKTKLGYTRIYLSGENLLTFTKMRVYDPEMPGLIYPFTKVFSAGLTVQF